MHTYLPPIDDYRFLLGEVLGFDGEMEVLGEDFDTRHAATVLEEAGRLCAERLQPMNGRRRAGLPAGERCGEDAGRLRRCLSRVCDCGPGVAFGRFGP